MKHLNSVKHPTLHFNDIFMNTNLYIDIIIYNKMNDSLPKIYLTSITRNTDEMSKVIFSSAIEYNIKYCYGVFKELHMQSSFTVREET